MEDIDAYTKGERDEEVLFFSMVEEILLIFYGVE